MQRQSEEQGVAKFKRLENQIELFPHWPGSNPSTVRTTYNILGFVN